MNRIAVLISANSEWRAVRAFYPHANLSRTPYGECFHLTLAGQAVTFMQQGWGKIAAAGGTQYAVDHFQPHLMINLGTCGGIEGRIHHDEIILAEETLVYDIIERMGDAHAALRHYAVRHDLSFLREPFPLPVRRARLLSADRDLGVDDLPMLTGQYDALAVDWESGAIAWVAQRNGLPCLILRGVTDLVGPQGGEADGQLEVFHDGTARVMPVLLNALPAWLHAVDWPRVVALTGDPHAADPAAL